MPTIVVIPLVIMMCFFIAFVSVALQAMVTVQMLSELEEIIQCKLVPERREAIKRTWWNRLQVEYGKQTKI